VKVAQKGREALDPKGVDPMANAVDRLKVGPKVARTGIVHALKETAKCPIAADQTVADRKAPDAAG
jgi:hypothetical protein